MRSRPVRRLKALAFAAIAAFAGIAAADTIVARFEAPPLLQVGDRARLVLVADVPPGMPVLVTPESDGATVEVVRGRLLRSDAVDPEASPLRFEVPVAARAAGHGVVRARVRSFECDAEDRCESAEGTASLTVRVERVER